MKGRFAVVEGCDGVGKSTLCKTIADESKYQLIKTPTRDYLRQRYFFDRPERPPLARFLFYSAGVFESGLKIDGLIAQEQNVVADRYHFSLQLYHEALIGRNLGSEIDSLDLLQPDVTFILYANPEIVFERMHKRNLKLSDYHLEKNQPFMCDINARMQNVPSSDRIIKIDTSELSPNGVYEKCKLHL